MKLSIVTPVYNGEEYIKETIESVLSQEGDFEVDYIIEDGLSTDKTLEIVKSYEKIINAGQYPIRCKKITFRWFSEKDLGMYDAIEKGFAHATGNIYAYINANDAYLPKAFSTVNAIFTSYPDVEWAKGINTTCDEKGNIISEGVCSLYRRPWLEKGIYGRSAYFVQQESVFWRGSLWKKACPDIASLHFAGDYALWITFAQYASLWSFNKRVSVFRKHEGQLSTRFGAYQLEQEKIAPHNFILEKRVLFFFLSRRFLKLNPKGVITRILFFVLFPFYKREWYIDFDTQNNPFKKQASSYLV
ncbi:MAG: glycosyltransferase [Patescibacteria group bacterium]